jgi:hypothetical protein
MPRKKKIIAKLSLWGKSMAPGDAKKSAAAKYATRWLKKLLKNLSTIGVTTIALTTNKYFTTIKRGIPVSNDMVA